MIATGEMVRVRRRETDIVAGKRVGGTAATEGMFPVRSRGSEGNVAYAASDCYTARSVARISRGISDA